LCSVVATSLSRRCSTSSRPGTSTSSVSNNGFFVFFLQYFVCCCVVLMMKCRCQGYVLTDHLNRPLSTNTLTLVFCHTGNRFVALCHAGNYDVAIMLILGMN
jgi:hypothetical protein